MLDLLFPPLCAGCGVLVTAPHQPLCTACRRLDAPLPQARRREAGIEALHPYDGPWQHALHRLKYDGALSWAGPLGRRLAHAPILAEPWERVVAVPLHWRRRMRRGFNQVEAILDAAARHRPDLQRRRAPGGVRRQRAGQPQQRRTAAARRRLAPDTFTVPPRRRDALAGRRILVVDDVVTTGATLHAVMEALRRAGAAAVGAVALLRTL